MSVLKKFENVFISQSEEKQFSQNQLHFFWLTIRKLYPSQRYFQFSGQSGTSMLCECIATTYSLTAWIRLSKFGDFKQA